VDDNEDANSLIYGSDDGDDSFLSEPPPSPTLGELDQQELAGNLAPPSPPRRPPIYDPETGEEMKIPEMTDEEFNASFGDQLARTGQVVKASQGSAKTVAVVAGAGAGAAVVAGVGVGLKKLMDSDDNDVDTNVDMFNGEQTGTTTQASTQAAATQASTQAAGRAATQAAAQSAAQ